MTARCRICKRPVPEGAPAPFCSQRCADVDLGAWVTGAYAIPSGASAEDDPDAEARPPAPDDATD